MAYGIGVEWINDYDNMKKLHNRGEDAGGFYEELCDHDGATGLFNWGDGNAFEDDFKADDRGGHAGEWIERADIVYFAGHGCSSGFWFRSDVPDDDKLRSDFTTTTAGNDGELRAGRGALKWLTLQCCDTLMWESPLWGQQKDVFDRWGQAFDGLHTILGYTNPSIDEPGSPGRKFASFLDGRWINVVYGLPEAFFGTRLPLPVIDSWFLMTQLTQGSGVTAAALRADSPGTDTGADHLVGHGYVSPDPAHGQGWFFRTWLTHTC